MKLWAFPGQQISRCRRPLQACEREPKDKLIDLESMEHVFCCRAATLFLTLGGSARSRSAVQCASASQRGQDCGEIRKAIGSPPGPSGFQEQFEQHQRTTGHHIRASYWNRILIVMLGRICVD